MYCIDEKILEQFFYHGTENISELIEGIIFFSTSEMHKLYPSLKQQYDTSNDYQLSQIKNIAYKCGLQYYRFIELNKKPSALIDYKTQDEFQIVKSIIDSAIEQALNKKYLIEYKVGYYYSREQEEKFSATYIKDHQIRKFWAIEVAEQLKRLGIQEKQNPVEYYKNWILTRLKNAQSRDCRDDLEICLLQNVKMQLDKRIQLLKGNESCLTI